MFLLFLFVGAGSSLLAIPMEYIGGEKSVLAPLADRRRSENGNNLRRREDGMADDSSKGNAITIDRGVTLGISERNEPDNELKTSVPNQQFMGERSDSESLLVDRRMALERVP